MLLESFVTVNINVACVVDEELADRRCKALYRAQLQNYPQIGKWPKGARLEYSGISFAQHWYGLLSVNHFPMTQSFPDQGLRQLPY